MPWIHLHNNCATHLKVLDDLTNGGLMCNLPRSNDLACEAIFGQLNDGRTCFLAGKGGLHSKNNDFKHQVSSMSTAISSFVLSAEREQRESLIWYQLVIYWLYFVYLLHAVWGIWVNKTCPSCYKGEELIYRPWTGQWSITFTLLSLI